MGNIHKSIKHTNTVLRTAQHALELFNADMWTTMPNRSQQLSHQKLLRDGCERHVHAVELDDGSGVALRIEVYAIETAEVTNANVEKPCPTEDL